MLDIPRHLIVLVSLIVIGSAPCAEAGGSAGKTTKKKDEPHDVWLPVGKDGISTVAVDPATGAVYGFVPGSGLWGSGDQGRTFVQLYDGKDGHCGSSFSISVDPADGRRILLLLQGPSVLTLDGGKTWVPVAYSGLWGSVDWSDPEAKTMIGRNGGHSTWMISRDAGKSWNQLAGKEWAWTVGLFDSHTWIVDGVSRTEDAGARYDGIAGGPKAKTTVMQMHDGVGYFLASDGLAASADGGRTWKVTSLPTDAAYGPFFPRSHTVKVAASKDVNSKAKKVKESVAKDGAQAEAEDRRMVIAGRDGFFGSMDGGETWKLITTLPSPPSDLPAQADHGGVGTCAWDPVHNVLYYCTSGQPTKRFLF